jgi:hypothetical protein
MRPLGVYLAFKGDPLLRHMHQYICVATACKQEGYTGTLGGALNMSGGEASRFSHSLVGVWSGSHSIRDAVPLIHTREGQGVAICPYSLHVTFFVFNLHVVLLLAHPFSWILLLLLCSWMRELPEPLPPSTPKLALSLPILHRNANSP